MTGTGEIRRRLAAGERDFQGASLAGANLRGADLRGANLRGASLRGANLHSADLRDAKLVRTDLGLADLGMADFAAADLNGADFRGANLKGACVSGATLVGANLRGADLHGADLGAAKLVRADLSRADLRVAHIVEADLRGADLRGADLAGANLRAASLQSASLHGADLTDADLTGANLRGANLTDTRLRGALFNGVKAGGTVFADLDLRQAKGLETLEHDSPSTVGVDTLSRSHGGIPEKFLRGCGLTGWEILAAKQLDPSLTLAEASELQKQALSARAQSRLQRKRVLISCSQGDSAFVEELRRLLELRGIYSWVAAHETKGPVRDRQAKLAIQRDLSLLLVLSEHSSQSDWVDHEVRLARKLEKSLGEPVLYPVRLDHPQKPSPISAGDAAAAESGLSFADWRDPVSMQKQVAKLLEAMVLFYPAPLPG